jgi:hypothetical protein
VRRKLYRRKNYMAHAASFPVVRVTVPTPSPSARAAQRLRESAQRNARIATLQRRRLLGRVRRALPTIAGAVFLVVVIYTILFMGAL